MFFYDNLMNLYDYHHLYADVRMNFGQDCSLLQEKEHDLYKLFIVNASGTSHVCACGWVGHTHFPQNWLVKQRFCLEKTSLVSKLMGLSWSIN